MDVDFKMMREAAAMLASLKLKNAPCTCAAFTEQFNAAKERVLRVSGVTACVQIRLMDAEDFDGILNLFERERITP